MQRATLCCDAADVLRSWLGKKIKMKHKENGKEREQKAGGKRVRVESGKGWLYSVLASISEA